MKVNTTALQDTRQQVNWTNTGKGERSFAEDTAAFLLMLMPLSKGIVITVLVGFFGLFIHFGTCGLPKKAPQHPIVKDGCPNNLVTFMGFIYTFTYFTTDQYAPSLPEMGLDLVGSQGLMSATIQMIFVVKAIAGILTASVSDRIGRRPVMLFCLSLLSLASFACACADHIEWFLAARVLQGIGESVEPVVFAMVRDYFPGSEHRYMIIAAMTMMSTFRQLVAPVFGGYTAHVFSWRFSFIVLAVLWAFMTAYAALHVVESCPDGARESHLTSLTRFFDLHLLILLLTESCNMAAYLVFSTNISYLVEVTYGKSTMTCSTVLLAYVAGNSLGLFLMERLHIQGILTKAKVSVTLFALCGWILFTLGVVFPGEFWAYCVGTMFHSVLGVAMLVSVNVLFFEPLKDCAGLAASLEIVAKSVLPSGYAVWSTRALIHSGARGMINFQAVPIMVGGVIFWFYALFPPSWMAEKPPPEG